MEDRVAGVAGQPLNRAGRTPRRRPGRVLLLTVVVTALVALAAGVGTGNRWAGAARLQDATPDAATPPAEQPTSELPPEAGFAGDAIHVQTIAQGLVVLEEGPVAWRVTEIEAPSEDEASPAEATRFSFTLQRRGVSVIRTEETGKRVRLEPGEGFFASAGDTFTRRREGADPSLTYLFELVPAGAPDDEAGGNVVYASEEIGDYPSGIYDAELVRDVLEPGESASLPDHTGPALVMATFGRLQTDEGGNQQILEAGGAQLAAGDLTITNGGAQPAVYVVALIGEQVEPGDAAAADGTPTADGTPAADDAAADDDADAGDDAAADVDSDGDGLTDATEAEVGTDPATADTDLDGLLDGTEVNDLGTSPFSADTDGDGIVDIDEINIYGTEPTVFDTDGDGVDDGTEVNNGTDPTDPSSGP